MLKKKLIFLSLYCLVSQTILKYYIIFIQTRPLYKLVIETADNTFLVVKVENNKNYFAKYLN